MIEFACPHCHRWLKVDNAYAGQQTQCACGQTLSIPVPLTEAQIQKSGASPCRNCGEHISLQTQVCPFCQEEKSAKQKAKDAQQLEERRQAKLARQAEKERLLAQQQEAQQAAFNRSAIPPFRPHATPVFPSAAPLPPVAEAPTLEDEIAAAYQARPTRVVAKRGNPLTTLLTVVVALVICTCAILCTIAIMRAPAKVIPVPVIRQLPAQPATGTTPAIEAPAQSQAKEPVKNSAQPAPTPVAPPAAANKNPPPPTATEDPGF